MNFQGMDYSLFDYSGFISDPESMITDRRYWEEEERDLLKLSDSLLKSIKMRSSSPPKSRHDGTSPLPLGMDWSPLLDGANTTWPHEAGSRWRYTVTVPSWSILFEPGSSKPVVFYRVQVGLQSPEKITTTHEVLRRFSSFLKLSSELKQSFRSKILPRTPPKDHLSMKNGPHVEKRRRALEEWLDEVLSDIDFSRSAVVACFLELEAAARLSFRENSDAELSANSDSGHLSSVSLSYVDEASTSLPNKDIDSSDVSGMESPVTETFYENDSNAVLASSLGHDSSRESPVREAQSNETVTRLVKENEAMHQELGFTRKKLEGLQKRHEQALLKSKADIKLLVKEIKALRTSQMELQQQLDTERAEFETRLSEEREEKERLCSENLKLLQECETIRLRLEEHTPIVDDVHLQQQSTTP